MTAVVQNSFLSPKDKIKSQLRHHRGSLEIPIYRNQIKAIYCSKRFLTNRYIGWRFHLRDKIRLVFQPLVGNGLSTSPQASGKLSISFGRLLFYRFEQLCSIRRQYSSVFLYFSSCADRDKYTFSPICVR